MSYGPAQALQAAIYQLLSADAGVTALVGTAIYDEVPPGPVAGTLISMGEAESRDLSDKSGGLAEHRLMICVVSDAEGFAQAQHVATAVSDALVDATPALSRGRIVVLSFIKARARRVRAGQVRRIDLTFRAIVEDDQ
ncbi:MAG: DUF3168 domain-containing protein [Pseudomonadota bacterium]